MQMKWYEMQSTGLGYGLVAGCCKHRDEHSGFKKAPHFVTSSVSTTLPKSPLILRDGQKDKDLSNMTMKR
jgi:hypothetical protein